MSGQPPDDDFDSDDFSRLLNPVRVWVAYGVSLAAALHVLVAALVLINRSH
ncbi:hypothetical protein ACFC58_09350 [Kitasatospora purpeofusca]|uniref:hypothetical protein n=1 Tax=Kitasatospora purpeofusca TaxID=67352 RepID=UPI0035DC80F8